MSAHISRSGDARSNRFSERLVKKSVETIAKTRIVVRGQQLCRPVGKDEGSETYLINNLEIR
jgi:hypothetical protein